MANTAKYYDAPTVTCETDPTTSVKVDSAPAKIVQDFQESAECLFCCCCEEECVECCKLSDYSGISYTPPPGYDLDSIEVTNTNIDNCVGRAEATIVVSKPACATEACSEENCDAIAPYDEETSRNIWCDGGHEGLRVALNSLLSQVSLAGVTYYPIQITDNMLYSPSFYEGVCSFDVTLFPDEASISCESPYVLQYSFPQFSKVFDPPRSYDSYSDMMDDLTTESETLCAQIGAALQALPPILVTCGGVKYCVKSNGFVGVNEGDLGPLCAVIDYEDDTYEVASMYLGSLFLGFEVTCGDDPCDDPPDWAATISCNCTGSYNKPDGCSPPTAGPPPCILVFSISNSELSGDKCLYTAIYQGRILAGVITCPPGTTEVDCICCGEPVS